MTNQPWGQPPQGQGFGAPAGPGFAPGATGPQASGPWPTYPQTSPGGTQQPVQYGPPGLPPSPPPRPPSGGARVALIIAIVLAIIVAGVLVGILVVSLRPKEAPLPPLPSSTAPTTAGSTTEPSPSGSASPSHPTATSAGGATRVPGTPGSFRDLRVPAAFDTFTAEDSPDGEYGPGRWIGTPVGGTSIGWWYKGTIGGTKGSIVGSIVQNASISDLNSYSFTDVTNVNGATCGSWLSSYEACFIAVDNGFVGVQVDRHDFGASASAGEVARLLAAYRAALS